jgi:hypothetical protein
MKAPLRLRPFRRLIAAYAVNSLGTWLLGLGPRGRAFGPQSSRRRRVGRLPPWRKQRLRRQSVVELAGLEPATSWVRYGNAIVRGRRRFGSRKRSLAGRVALGRSADSRGLPGVAFDLGHWKRPVPIHLSRTINCRVPTLRPGLRFSCSSIFAVRASQQRSFHGKGGASRVSAETAGSRPQQELTGIPVGVSRSRGSESGARSRCRPSGPRPGPWRVLSMS